GVQGGLGWCAPDGTHWMACDTDADCGGRAGACNPAFPGTVPQARKGSCVGHLGSGVSVPTGCQTVADLGACNANLTGAGPPPPPARSPRHPPRPRTPPRARRSCSTSSRTDDIVAPGPADRREGIANAAETWHARAMPDYSLFGDEHVRQYEATGGKVGHDWNDANVLILHTTGRKSGGTRKLPLIYGRDGKDYLIVASK